MLGNLRLEDVWQSKDQDKLVDYKVLADDLLHNELLEKLLDELDYLACLKMFRKSQTLEDIMFSKALLYNNDLLKKKIKQISTGDLGGAKKLGR